jgi:hypothetical protein
MRVRLPAASQEALASLALRERRSAEDEASWLIVRALARRRLVSADGLRRLDAATADETELRSPDPPVPLVERTGGNRDN